MMMDRTIHRRRRMAKNVHGAFDRAGIGEVKRLVVVGAIGLIAFASGCSLTSPLTSRTESVSTKSTSQTTVDGSRRISLTPDARWGRQAWTDSDGIRRDTSVAFRPGAEAGVVEIDYSFGSTKATQAHVDLPLDIPEVFKEVSFELMGDGSGNQIQLWLNGLAGKWHRQGGDAALSGTDWTTVRCEVFGTPTDIARRARFVVVQKAGAGKGVVRLRNFVFSGVPSESSTDLGHVFAEVPKGLPYLDGVKDFHFERKRVDDRAVLLVDGEPLFCVLDAQLDTEFLKSARQAGVNTLAIDLYWRNLEPRAGYADWERLDEQIKAYGALRIRIDIPGQHPPAHMGHPSGSGRARLPGFGMRLSQRRDGPQAFLGVS